MQQNKHKVVLLHRTSRGIVPLLSPCLGPFCKMFPKVWDFLAIVPQMYSNSAAAQVLCSEPSAVQPVGPPALVKQDMPSLKCFSFLWDMLHIPVCIIFMCHHLNPWEAQNHLYTWDKPLMASSNTIHCCSVHVNPLGCHLCCSVASSLFCQVNFYAANCDYFVPEISAVQSTPSLLEKWPFGNLNTGFKVLDCSTRDCESQTFPWLLMFTISNTLPWPC